MMRVPSGIRRLVLAAMLSLTTLSCASAPATDAGTDAGPDAAGVCADAEAAFDDFVAANLSCTTAAECAVIGDCGGNADFTAIRADAAATGLALMRARCVGFSDGGRPGADCQSGRCVTSGLESLCHPVDAGPRCRTDFDCPTGHSCVSGWPYPVCRVRDAGGMDSGSDAGSSDAGGDGGSDAGGAGDAGSDAASDSGPIDASFDASFDAGSDASSDADSDAGG